MRFSAKLQRQWSRRLDAHHLLLQRFRKVHCQSVATTSKFGAPIDLDVLKASAFTRKNQAAKKLVCVEMEGVG